MSSQNKNSAKAPIQTRLQIKTIPINQIIPNTYNPRTWDESQKQKLKEGLQEFGQVDPLLLNSSTTRKNILIGGHMRLECMKELGFKLVQVVYLDIPDEQKEKELCLRLNKNTGSWDYELLKEFDLESLLDIGFTDSDLTDMWDNLLTIEDDQFDLEKAVAEAATTDMKPGDKFRLGSSLLICGDSLDKTNYEYAQEFMGIGVKATTYLTDPIFNIALDYNKGTGGKSSYGGSTKDNMSKDEYREFIISIANNAKSLLAGDAHLFMFCDQNYVGMFQGIIEELGAKNQRTCIWLKNGFNATPQCAFNKMYEPCIYATIGKPYLDKANKNLSEILNRDVASGNRMHDDILDMLDIWIARRDAVSEYHHPTQKPLSLLEKPIRRCTKPGDWIIDTFGGSGTILLAAHQLKRRVIMIEKEPIFCQVILDRFETMTGEKGVKL